MLPQAFIELIVKTFGSPIRSSVDCEALMHDIYSRTRQHIGTTTLRRLMGFIAEERSPRISTLDILARYVGYPDYSVLYRKLNGFSDSDMDCRLQSVDIEALNVGDEVTFTYIPDRRVKLRYLGDNRFEVAESEGSRLQPGDTMVIGSIVEGLPLVAEHLMRDGADMGRYVAGKQAGLTSVERLGNGPTA